MYYHRQRRIYRTRQPARTSYDHRCNSSKGANTKPSRNCRKAKHKLLPYGAPKKGTSHRYKSRSKMKRKPPQCPKRQGLPLNQIGTSNPATDGHFNNSKEGEHNKIPTSHLKKHGHNVAPACKGVLIPHTGLVKPGTVSGIQTGLRLQSFPSDG
jgi:hypothetical protein